MRNQNELLNLANSGGARASTSAISNKVFSALKFICKSIDAKAGAYVEDVSHSSPIHTELRIPTRMTSLLKKLKVRGVCCRGWLVIHLAISNHEPIVTCDGYCIQFEAP